MVRFASFIAALAVTTVPPPGSAPEVPEASVTVPAGQAAAIVRFLGEQAASAATSSAGTPTVVQHYLAQQLGAAAGPPFLFAEGDDRFFFRFDGGINVVGIVPGTDLQDQWVVVGARYDRLGACRPARDAARVCNSAADNAAVAAVLQVAKAVAAEPNRRRSLLIALWDTAGDGNLGFDSYMANRLFRLDATAAYVNLDVLGSAMSPALATSTMMVGAETGGKRLVEAATAAVSSTTLDVRSLSLRAGLGPAVPRQYLNAGVPTVTLTDGRSGCYHSVNDTAAGIDSAKLDEQSAIAARLTLELLNADKKPVLNPGAPQATFADASAIHDMLTAATPDLTVTPELQAYDDALAGSIAAGAERFDAAASDSVLAGVPLVVEAVRSTGCPIGGSTVG